MVTKIDGQKHIAQPVLRYPGGKQRLLEQFIQYMHSAEVIRGRYIEPFLGGASVFFAVNPASALLSDVNQELIDLYRGIRRNPRKVWKLFCGFPDTKESYYETRNGCTNGLDMIERAARTLYLNRTCFKGMWRHNSSGQFNVGYGGQERRWVITEQSLCETSQRLKTATLKRSDFEKVVDSCGKGDFAFCDPPYRPGESEILNDHYVHAKFTLAEHKRLADALHRATERKAAWAMTTSSHPDIVALYPNNNVISLTKGTGRQPGLPGTDIGEVFIYNYTEV